MRHKGKNSVLLAASLIAIAFVILSIQSYQARNNPLIKGADIAINNDNERIAFKSAYYQPAKELVNPDGFINTQKITIGENIGKKVIMVDFWTYTCINCQRTLPFLNVWHEKYSDKGLLIIGVHTPEFSFEKKLDNVIAAVEKYNVKYPVVQDNDYLTWSAYQNRYWPRKYLIDIDGFIVYDHIGEGAYEETENKIIQLLEERGRVVNETVELNKSLAAPNAAIVDYSKIRTPELYFGYNFARPGQFGNNEGRQPGFEVSYSLPAHLEENKFYLEGEWKNNADEMIAVTAGRVLLKYTAKSVNVVAGADKPILAEVYVNSIFLGNLTVSGFDLYNVVEGEEYASRLLELRVGPGLMLYTFTFG
jgi:thiol-disulfide isomerase/thioredoxin